MKKFKLSTNSVVVVKNSSIMPMRIQHVSKRTVIAKPLGSSPMIIRKEFCVPATKLDIDKFILQKSKELVKIEMEIEALESLQKELAEAKIERI